MKRFLKSLAGVITILCVIAPSLLSAVTIPIDRSHGIVIVDVIINDKIKGKFGIDTGADFLYIDKEFAKKNNLKFVNSPNRRAVRGVEGTDDPVGLSIQSLNLGSERLENLAASAVDLNSFVSSMGTLKLDGLIGHEILKQFYITVDFDQNSLTLQTDRPRFLNGKQFEKINFKMYKHLILVDVEIESSVTVPMILDYCSSHTLVDPGLAEELGLPNVDNRPLRLSEVRLSRKISSSDVVAFVIDLKSLKHALPRAKFNGALGGSFLKDYVVTIDYSSRTLYFHLLK